MLFGQHNTITTFKVMLLGILLVATETVFAAIGCTLSNPAEDLKYLFPTMTTYKEELKELPRIKDGQKLFADLRERLGSDLDPIYETFETPYTVYNIFKGTSKVGIVHGVNVPGKGGVIQVFLSTDPKSGDIRKFFFQRLESPAAPFLKKPEFKKQFESLNLGDFYKHDYYVKTKTGSGNDKVGKIQQPAGLDVNGKPDYEATLRGVRKNLILLDFFIYDRRFEPFFEKAKQAMGDKK